MRRREFLECSENVALLGTQSALEQGIATPANCRVNFLLHRSSSAVSSR